MWTVIACVNQRLRLWNPGLRPAFRFFLSADCNPAEHAPVLRSARHVFAGHQVLARSDDDHETCLSLLFVKTEHGFGVTSFLRSDDDHETSALLLVNTGLFFFQKRRVTLLFFFKNVVLGRTRTCAG